MKVRHPSGPGIWGPPKDEKEAIAVLKTAVELGVDHIDTSAATLLLTSSPS